MLRRSSKYRHVELNALITSAWISLERYFMKSLSLQNKNKSATRGQREESKYIGKGSFLTEYNEKGLSILKCCR